MERKVVSHFEILRELGRGNRASVFLAVDLDLRRPVAIKFLSTDLVHDKAARRRFTREARLAARLRHPGIAQVHEYGVADGRPFLALEFVEGENLARLLEAGGPLAPERVRALARDLGDALAYAHSMEVIHRDVKPGNVILKPGGRPVLVDLGLAHSPDFSTITGPGLVSGTVSYLSPEQIRGERGSPASDIWSLGVLLYESLLGRMPFTGRNVVEVIDGVLESEPAAPTEDERRLDPPLVAAILRCLDKDPGRRPPRADEVVSGSGD